MRSASWLSPLLGAALQLGCGVAPERADTAGGASRSLPELSRSDAGSVRPRGDDAARHEGVLTVTARSALQRQLDVIDYVVKNAAGEVLAGGVDEAASGGSGARELSLALPAGEGMQLELSATTAQADGSLCRASVGPFRIDAGAVASFQVFIWRCDGASGAAAPEPECYWLADWIGVTRTNAAVGEVIGLSAAGHDARGKLPRFKWSTSSSTQGRFDDDEAAETTFRCAAASVAVPLRLTMSDGRCHKTFSELVACR